MRYLVGKVVELREKGIVVETQDKIGLKITTLNFDNYTLNKKHRIFTHVETKISRADVITNIFGFLNESYLRIFEILISIKGIGPKKAIGIMNGKEIEIKEFLRNKNVLGLINVIGADVCDPKILSQWNL